MHSIKQALQAIQVYDIPTFNKIRIGNKQDGGYVLLKEICDVTPAVYSFGVGNDIGFELSWIDSYPKTKISFYDPYVRALPSVRKQFSLYKKGIGGKHKLTVSDFTKNALLKMDIEGDEWNAFDSLTDQISLFSQILIEFHFLHVASPCDGSPYFTEMYKRHIDKVNDGLFASYESVLTWLNTRFVLFHIHANNSLAVVNVGGHWFPPLLEASYVRRNLLPDVFLTKHKGQFPIEGLDYQNKSDRPDIINYYPLGGKI